MKKAFSPGPAGKGIGYISMIFILGLFLLAGPPFAVAGEKFIFSTPNPGGLNVAWANFYLALDRGYFKAEGIDEIELMHFNGTATLLPQIVNKKILIGAPNADIPLISQQPGRDAMPLTFFYNFMRSSVWEMVVPAESPIKRLEDLKGKKIGVGALTWASVPTTRAMLHEVGLEDGKTVTLVGVGIGGPAFKAFREGQVDALNLYDGQHVLLELSGVKIRRLPQPEKYTNLFSTGFITHSDNIETKAKLLEGFGRAVSKGTVACFSNPEACVKAYYKHNPQAAPKPEREKETMARDIAVLEARGKSYLSFPKEAEQKFGWYPDGSFENFVQVLHAEGTLKTNKIPLEKLYTNRFVGGINQFDKEALRKEARSWK
jgi:NitT/TauT family transport system substrate-binding protein